MVLIQMSANFFSNAAVFVRCGLEKLGSESLNLINKATFMLSANEFPDALLGNLYFTSTYFLKISRVGALLKIVLFRSPVLPSLILLTVSFLTDLECLRCVAG